MPEHLDMPAEDDRPTRAELAGETMPGSFGYKPASTLLAGAPVTAADFAGLREDRTQA